jgi:hypothetical protein
MFFGFFPFFLLFFIIPMLIGRAFRHFSAHRGERDLLPNDPVPPDRELFDRYERGRLEGQIFRLAKRRGGTLTLSEIIIETGLGLKEAERFMDDLVDGRHVRLEVNGNGRLVYEFPELMERSS